MIKKEIIILYYGLRDKRTTPIAKIPAIISIIYLLNPVDLIPDFIPFLGYVDDLVVVPLLLNLAVRLLPPEVREESIQRASRNKWKFQAAGIIVIILVLAILVGIFFLVRHFLSAHT